MEILEMVRRWLLTFPGWEGADIAVDRLGAAPGALALYPKGMEERGRMEDVLGNEKRFLRCGFSLRWVGHTPGDTDGALALALQQWVLEQSAQGLAPRLGEHTLWRGELGRHTGGKGPGTGVYEVNLTADFTKIL